MEKLTIILPVYNGMPWLPAAVESVLSQSVQDFKLIVSNDCSTDGTKEYLDSLTDPRIEVFDHPKNLGATDNWNFGLGKVQSQYCLLLCADDVLHEGALQDLLTAALNANPTVGLISGRRRVVGPDGSVIIKKIGIGPLLGFCTGSEAIRTIVKSGRNLVGEPSSTLFDANLARKVGGFRNNFKFCPDLDLWVRMLSVSDFVGLNRVICDFRLSSSSGSYKMAKIQQEQSTLFFKSLKKSYPFISRRDALLGLAKVRVASWIRRVLYRRIS